MNLLSANQTWPFGVALMIMLGLSILEAVGLLISHSPSQFLDHLVPDSPEGFDGPMGWLHLGKVPILVLIILFLASFSLCGYFIQLVAHWMSGYFLPTPIASLCSLLVGLLSTSTLGGVIARVIPHDESSAVSEMSLIGRSGLIVRGIASQGVAAEAKVRDSNGHAHYVMVEPDVAGEHFAEGQSVLLVSKSGAKYRAIINPHPELL